MKGIFIIRMIGNNTSDYVATDLIHQLWCQHHETYGHNFPDEPHQKCNTCTFKHAVPVACVPDSNYKYFDPVRKLSRMTSLDVKVTNAGEKVSLKPRFLALNEEDHKDTQSNDSY